MSMSGVTVDDACVEAWGKLKKGQIKCAVFKLTDDKKKIEVVPDTCLPSKRGETNPEDFEQFQTFMPENTCRYAVYNIQISLKGSDNIVGQRDKMCFITWAPDTAKIKDKMLTAASKDALKKRLDGIALEFQCSCESDLQATSFIEKLQDVPNIKLAGSIISYEGRDSGDW